MRKGIFIILMLISSVFTGMAQSNAVQTKINAIQSDNYMKNASISFYAVNMETGDEIAKLNENTSLIPASIMKLFTTSTAFQTLGAGHQIKTEILHDGEIDSNGVLHGNIYIKGYGDPTWGSRFFTKDGHEFDFMKKWVDTVKAFGIKEVDGYVIADGSYFSYEGVPAGWNWSDMGNYYGSGPAGLSVFDNMVYLHFRTGDKKDDPTVIDCVEPHVPNLVFRNEVLSSDKRGDNSYIYGGPFSLDRFVVGTLPKGEEDFKVKGSIPDPEDFFGYAFTNMLEERGVPVKYRHQTMRQLQLTKEEKDSLKLKEIKTFKGQKLYRIINLINQRSVNLFAEALLNYMGAQKYGTGSAWNGTAAVERYWRARNNMTGFYMNDGSGLSRTNAVSSKHFVDMLKYMSTQKSFDFFKKSLAQTGKRGTIRSMCRGGAGYTRVYGKSGSMNRVRSYAGYVYSKSGKKIAFAIIFNNFNCSSTQVKRMCESLFNVMASF